MVLLVLDAGKWVLEVLAEPNGCEGIQAGDCRRVNVIFQCESDLVVMAADGMNA